MGKGIPQWVIQMLAWVLPYVLKYLSKELGDELKASLVKLYKKALASPSKMDELVIGALLDALKIPRP